MADIDRTLFDKLADEFIDADEILWRGVLRDARKLIEGDGLPD